MTYEIVFMIGGGLTMVVVGCMLSIHCLTRSEHETRYVEIA